MNFRTFARLGRITNAPTVAADVAAGFLVAAGYRWIWLFDPGFISGIRPGEIPVAGFGPPWLAVLLLMLSGICLYTGGMIDNDAKHAAKDQLLNKPRPIIQRLVSRDAASALARTLFLAGIALASLSAMPVSIPKGIALPAFLVAILIALLASNYNRLAAGRMSEAGWHPPSRGAAVAGVFHLALARACAVGLGVVLGLSLVARGEQQIVTTVSEALGLFDIKTAILLATSFAWFGLLTALSLFEESPAPKRAVKWLSSLISIVLWLGPISVYVIRYDRFADPRWMSECLPALFLLLLASVFVWNRFADARRDPTPANIGKCIGTGITVWPLVLASYVFLSLSTRDGRDTGWPAVVAPIVIASMTPLSLWLRRFGRGT